MGYFFTIFDLRDFPIIFALYQAFPNIIETYVAWTKSYSDILELCCLSIIAICLKTNAFCEIIASSNRKHSENDPLEIRIIFDGLLKNPLNCPISTTDNNANSFSRIAEFVGPFEGWFDLLFFVQVNWDKVDGSGGVIVREVRFFGAQQLVASFASAFAVDKKKIIVFLALLINLDLRFFLNLVCRHLLNFYDFIRLWDRF